MFECEEIKHDVIFDETVLDQVLANKPDLVRVICAAVKKLRSTVGDQANIYLEIYFDEQDKPQFYLVCETTMKADEVKDLEKSTTDWLKQVRNKINYTVDVTFETY